MFNFKESYMLLSVSQGPSVPYQFLENIGKVPDQLYSMIDALGRIQPGKWVRQ